jgi:hypothetical protein
MLNKGNKIHNFISSSGSGTVINYGSGSVFLTSYGSGSTSQKVTVPTVPVPQRYLVLLEVGIPVDAAEAGRALGAGHVGDHVSRAQVPRHAVVRHLHHPARVADPHSFHQDPDPAF